MLEVWELLRAIHGYFASGFLLVKIPDLHFYMYALLDSGELYNFLV